MKNQKEPNFKKRKRLERDYCEYSKDNIPHTLQGQYAIKYAKNFHDRAITCIDLANIYWQNSFYDAALIYVKSGIADLNRAKNIYLKLQSNPQEVKRCDTIQGIFKQNVKTIKSAIKENYDFSQEKKPQIRNESPARTSIFKTPECSPKKLKEATHEGSALDENQSPSEKQLFSIIDWGFS